MGYWGKVIGSTAGFFMAGPAGAVIGAALGHAADSGAIGGFKLPFGADGTLNPIRVAGLMGRRDEVFAIAVTVLAAKLSKVDGPVKRGEIDAFKASFRIPPDSARNIARLFDNARDTAESFEPYAAQLGESFADNRGLLEDVLRALFVIARADGPLNGKEQAFLRQVHRHMGLDAVAWERAAGGQSRAAPGLDEPDPYRELGVSRSASGEELRAAWKTLMRENHPDSLAARGVPADFVARASQKVARINAAWDRIKRERGL
ncbi:TerB family tellurite resistance protein [Rhodopila sp.]|uniref:TerB family tellurite resistance protein n=1 Tax=Rhodopila sp. TaxID=2480087 RepID=UPI002BFB7FD5|nr:TerB family tellurite resistance protein [Rhodopila sp.]HVZ08188.1 TerB family tellurite resistance protein [Rhodopila sp.]